MDVSEAVDSRLSVREFLKDPVDDQLIKELLEKSARSASGGNLQPWKIYVINNETMDSFLKHQEEWSEPETPAYAIYPENLKEPYKTSRFEVGVQMYSILDIGREDKEGRFKQMLRNYEFFGAPAAFFCFVDRQMGTPQWSDLGMFLQTFMLLAREEGLDTCPQEAWAMKQESVTAFVEAPDEEMLFCGMAIGYRDPEAPINSLRTERRPIDTWAKFIKKQYQINTSIRLGPSEDKLSESAFLNSLTVVVVRPATPSDLASEDQLIGGSSNQNIDAALSPVPRAPTLSNSTFKIAQDLFENIIFVTFKDSLA